MNIGAGTAENEQHLAEILSKFRDGAKGSAAAPVRRPQTLLFSATTPSWVKKLTSKYLEDPELVDVVGDVDAVGRAIFLRRIRTRVLLLIILGSLQDYVQLT